MAEVRPRRDSAGRWLPGCSGNPAGRQDGRPKLSDVLRRMSAEPPEELHYATAAAVLGLERCLVPVVERLVDLYAWVESIRGLASVDAFREVFDRLDPKPQRVDLTTGGAPLRAPVPAGRPENAERDAAEDFYDELHREPEPKPPELH